MNNPSQAAGPSETILQFGTGILLRGLPDFFIQQGNERGNERNRIVVVKSTPGNAEEFNRENCVFTTCIRGVANGERIAEDKENQAISRVLVASHEWQAILDVGASQELKLILSNTTEVGIRFVAESAGLMPPESFPGKLTAVLYQRFIRLGISAPLIAVVPTELIPDNGQTLKGIVLQLIKSNQLESEFESWLERHVFFCDSLVDRIVTKPSDEVLALLSKKSPLTIQAEPYRLWAIQGGSITKDHLSFLEVDEGVIITDDIAYYRERKLRLLNGTHTISVCLGFLKGFNTVYECMQDDFMKSMISRVMMNEIQPTLALGSSGENESFAMDVLDRFNNPYTVHRLLSITFQSTAKMKMRNIATVQRYFHQFQKAPELMALGFAAYLLFMRATSTDGKNYFGVRKGESYLINDDHAGYFFDLWNAVRPGHSISEEFTREVCSKEQLWGTNLSVLPGWVNAVHISLTHLMNEIDL